jgi:hypothetical protein
MILDVSSILSAAQAVTVTAPSTGVYDTAGLGVGQPVTNIFGLATTDSSFGEDLGGGGPHAEGPQLAVIVSTAFTAGGAATLKVQLQAAPDTTNTGTPGTWQTIQQSDDFALATLALGQMLTKWTVPGRYPGSNFPRFYRLNYVVSTGPMTAGALNAYLLTGIDDNPLYPANY